jgi:hypothetical protein
MHHGVGDGSKKHPFDFVEGVTRSDPEVVIELASENDNKISKIRESIADVGKLRGKLRPIVFNLMARELPKTGQSPT